MRGRTAIGINDDLAAGQAGIAVRSADDEIACRIHQEILLGHHPSIGKDVGDDRRHQPADIGLAGIGVMLRRQHDLLRALRTPLIIINKRDLALRIRAEDGVLHRPSGSPQDASGSDANNGSAPASEHLSRGRHSRT